MDARNEERANAIKGRRLGSTGSKGAGLFEALIFLFGARASGLRIRDD